MKGFPEYDYVVAEEPGGCGLRTTAASLSEAFYRLGFHGPKFVRLVDGGDRVLVRKGFLYGHREHDRSVTFSLNGLVHLPAWEVLAAYETEVLVPGKQTRAVSRGFRHMPVKVHHWNLRGDFLALRACGERKANHGLLGDEECVFLGIRARAKRLFVYADKFERQSSKDRCWKRFRKTRWKECA